MKIVIKYISSWITIIIPTIFFLSVFLAIWLGVPYCLYYCFNYKNTTVLNLLGSLGWIWSGIITFVLSVVLYKSYWKIPQKFMKSKYISFDNTTLNWDKHKTINLLEPYKATISANLSATGKEIHSSIHLNNKKYSINIHIPDFTRNELLEYFPDDEFIDSLSISIYEGSYGYKLNYKNDEERKFYISLIKALWEYKHNNEYYTLFQKFPWKHKPNPNFKYIRLYDTTHLSNQELAFIEKIKNNCFSAPVDYILLAPDYILITDIKKYIVMPIGYVKARTRQTDSTHYIIFDGIDQNHNKVSYKYWWIDMLNNKYDESKLFIMYINNHYFLKHPENV